MWPTFVTVSQEKKYSPATKSNKSDSNLYLLLSKNITIISHNTDIALKNPFFFCSRGISQDLIFLKILFPIYLALPLSYPRASSKTLPPTIFTFSCQNCLSPYTSQVSLVFSHPNIFILIFTLE